MAEEKKEEKPKKKKRIPFKDRKWDEERRNAFEDEMEEIIYKMIGDFRMEDPEIETFVDEIVDIANKKLKGNGVRNYLYWSTIFVCGYLDKHKNQRGMMWEKRYDHV